MRPTKSPSESKSRLLAKFGGPDGLRHALRVELDRLQERTRAQRRSVSSDFFYYEEYAPTEDDIRNLRKRNKKRDHIFNYERVKAEHLWTGAASLVGDIAGKSLYRFKDGVLTINEQHYPILVKPLLSLALTDRLPVKTARLGEPLWREPEPLHSLVSTFSYDSLPIWGYGGE